MKAMAVNFKGNKYTLERALKCISKDAETKVYYFDIEVNKSDYLRFYDTYVSTIEVYTISIIPLKELVIINLF